MCQIFWVQQSLGCAQLLRKSSLLLYIQMSEIEGGTGCRSVYRVGERGGGSDAELCIYTVDHNYVLRGKAE